MFDLPSLRTSCKGPLIYGMGNGLKDGLGTAVGLVLDYLNIRHQRQHRIQVQDWSDNARERILTYLLGKANNLCQGSEGKIDLN